MPPVVLATMPKRSELGVLASEVKFRARANVQVRTRQNLRRA